MSSASWLRRAGVAGAAAGAVAAGAALGVAGERVREQRRTRTSGGPHLPTVTGTETVVIADDGVVLHAEVDEQDGSPGHVDGALTLVLCHGYTLTAQAWIYQRAALRDLGRIVTYDQRGHGRSGRGEPARASIDQLGSDLERVLEALAPTGPIVLVGHSMGGMSVMALAERRPDLFGDRVIGVALLSTSAGALAEWSFGLPLRGGRLLRRVMPPVFGELVRRPALVTRGRRVAGEVELALTRRYSFGSDVPPWLVAFASGMISGTSLDTVADFWPAFDDHDKLAALPVLAAIPVLVLVGEDDLLTPAAHSRAIATALPHAELVIVPASGHLVTIEHPETVDAHLRALVDRSLTQWRDHRRSARGGGAEAR